MNEVTKINLGRQVFIITADAHHDLRNYLDSIKKEVSEDDVIEEVEIRMSELLSERGLGGEKVVLKKDIDFIKKQLGSPKDFKDDSETSETVEVKNISTRRLFRDTDNAIIGGVAAGLARYFGFDVLLLRILFIVLLIITFGGGILLYVLLWILIPEAKTASDRLQMAGKPVTVESLKELAKDADVRGAARRVNDNLSGPINRVFSIILKLIGVVIMVYGLAVVFGLIAGLIYFLTKINIWGKYNIFPVGSTQHILLYVAMAVVALGAVFVILVGLAIFKRKWPIHSWITGSLVGLLLIGLAACGALSASVYPTVRNAYDSNLHTTTRSLKPFNSLNVIGGVDNVNFQYASKYYVSFNYFDNPKLSNIKTSVHNESLTINTNQFDPNRNCQVLCVPDSYNMNITIYSPNLNQLENQFDDVGLVAPAPPKPFVN